VPSSPLAIPIC